MNRTVKMSIALGALAATGACASVVADEGMSAEAARRLAEFDRTGETVDCLSSTTIDSITALDDRHFLVRVGVNRYYLNEVGGRCSSASQPGYRIQYELTTSQLCQNQIVTVVDNLSNITAGSCGLGEFERLEKKPREAAE